VRHLTALLVAILLSLFNFVYVCGGVGPCGWPPNP